MHLLFWDLCVDKQSNFKVTAETSYYIQVASGITISPKFSTNQLYALNVSECLVDESLNYAPRLRKRNDFLSHFISCMLSTKKMERDFHMSPCLSILVVRIWSGRILQKGTKKDMLPTWAIQNCQHGVHVLRSCSES